MAAGIMHEEIAAIRYECRIGIAPPLVVFVIPLLSLGAGLGVSVGGGGRHRRLRIVDRCRCGWSVAVQAVEFRDLLRRLVADLEPIHHRFRIGSRLEAVNLRL